MHKIDPDIIRHMARLARIRLEPNEIEPQREHFSRLLDLVSRLADAELAEVPPMHHPLDLSQPLREDRAVTASAGTELLKRAPAAAEQLFLVPRVIE